MDCLTHIDDADPALARKLIKLMATAKGSGASEQEMETALAAAQRIAIQHRIDLATITEGSSGLSAPVEEMAEDKLRVGKGKRKPPANRFIVSLLVDHFNVEVIYAQDYKDEDYRRRRASWVEAPIREAGPRPDPPSTVLFLGRRSDVAFAKYAYGYLQSAFARAWRVFKQENDAPMSERASFYLGVWRGLDRKLSSEKKKVEVELLAEAALDPNAYALAVVSEADEREAFKRNKHPVLGKAKYSPVNVVSSDAVYAGQEAGGKITIANALEPAKAKPEIT